MYFSVVFNQSLFKKFIFHQKNRFPAQSFIKSKIAERLLDKLSFIKLVPKNIFVEGFEDSYLNVIKEIYPKAKISVDLTEFTAFDAIISHCKIQQTSSVNEELSSWYSHLKPEGVVVFASFGSSTLQEVKNAWQLIDGMVHINQMLVMNDLGDFLVKQEFKNVVMDRETLILQYKDLRTLFQDIRELNEPLADSKMRETFTGKKRWQKFCERLAKKSLSVSYEIFYGYGYKDSHSLGLKGKIKSQETLISFDVLREAVKHKT